MPDKKGKSRRPNRLSGLQNIDSDLSQLSETDSLTDQQLRALIDAERGDNEIPEQDISVLLKSVAGYPYADQITKVKAQVKELTKGKIGRPPTKQRDRLTTMMDADLKQRLKKYAFENGMSLADVLESLVENLLKKEGY